MIATKTPITTLRTASVADLRSLAPLAEEFYASSTMLKKFDINCFVALWTALLTNGNGVVFVLESDGEVTGTLGAVCHPETYSAALIAQEFHLYISKESRGGFGLMKLLRAFEKWSRERGCSEMRIAHLQDLQPVELARLYTRLGFHQIETSYGKALD